MDFEIARSNMIEQQIRPWNVLEMQTLNAVAGIRREDFVPEQYKQLAFADIQIAIGDNEVMLEPKIGARMIEAMALSNSDHVLQIGTGTGYLTAVLASICSHVTSVEIDSELHVQAGRNLAMAGIDNTTLVHQDCFEFCPQQANNSTQFDSILITGSVPSIEEMFLKLIKPNGRLVGIQGDDPAMQAVVVDPSGEVRSLFETSVPRLRNTTEKTSFSF